MKTPDVVKIVVAFLMLALRLSAEINVVPTGKNILLLSSKQIATQLPQEIREQVMESLHNTCLRHGMSFVRFKQIGISNDEITRGFYIASRQDPLTNDLVWHEKRFKLVHYQPQLEEIHRLKKMEGYGYKLTGGLLFILGGATGGLSPFAPKEISLIMGAFSLSLSLWSTAVALSARRQWQDLNDRCPIDEEPAYIFLQDDGIVALEVETNQPPPKKPQYALPILASELWCQ